MTVADIINEAKSTVFSFELLPPLKGNKIDKVYKTIDSLIEFNPKFITITSHRDEVTYKNTENGLFERRVIRKRPGTVAVAAAIMHKYNVKVIPHIICSGFTRSETEYALIDLNFLGIHDILVLRGDNSRKDRFFTPSENGNEYAVELAHQVNALNRGEFIDGTNIEPLEVPFAYGVAGYPEKHEEAPNMNSDLYHLKQKVDAGANFIVTQMFFDNQKYYDFVKRCREMDINIPIIPGLKPITAKVQETVLPKIFKTDIPEEFAKELRKCKTDEEVRRVGVEWTIHQSKDLMNNGSPILHFYTMMATQSVREVAQAVF
ncbi:MAG: methylenetetrahydrofolate reductase [NAD(P)H] [Marinilabiliaceae bacterium]|nr:methylenetetrahydrofolate reductase [NAD(P)H] [Marinilabiliaceae bacterium]